MQNTVDKCILVSRYCISLDLQCVLEPFDYDLLACKQQNCPNRLAGEQGKGTNLPLKQMFVAHPNLCQMSLILRKIAYAKNKGADQVCSDPAADQCVCFGFRVQSLYFLNLKIKPLAIFCIVTAQFVSNSLCQTWSRTPKIGFLMLQLK